MGYNTEFQLQDGSWCSTVSTVTVLRSERFGNRGSILEREEAFLGAPAKLRKATFRIVVSVCPSVRMEQLGSYWMDVHLI